MQETATTNTELKFWEAINFIDWPTRKLQPECGNIFTHLRTKYSRIEINKLEDFVKQKQTALFCSVIGQATESNMDDTDDLLHFIGGIVVLGKEEYERHLKNPKLVFEKFKGYTPIIFTDWLKAPESDMQEVEYWNVISRINWQLWRKEAREYEGNEFNKAYSLLNGMYSQEYLKGLKNFIIEKANQLYQVLDQYQTELKMGERVSNEDLQVVSFHIVALGEGIHHESITNPILAFVRAKMRDYVKWDSFVDQELIEM